MLPARADFQELKARVLAAAAQRAAREPMLPTGIPALDTLLGGGVPRGCLVTLEGTGSAGRRSIAAALLSAATGSGLGAIVDTGELYPPDLEEAGVRLDRLLIVPARTPLLAARAVDLLLRSRTARVVVMAVCALRAAVWARLANLAHKAGAVLVVIADRPIAELSAVAAIALVCRLERPRLRGRGLWAQLFGFDCSVALRKTGRSASLVVKR
jgi:hypothetical protein